MNMRFRFSGKVITAACAVLLTASVACEGSSNMDPGSTTPPGLVQLKTLSNRADMVSGGDALVEVFLPANTTAAQLSVKVGTRDVSSDFAVRADGRIIGLVTGLVDGPNKVTADLAGHNAASLTITSHNIGGPVFAGKQVELFVCATPDGSVDPDTKATTNVSGLSTLAFDKPHCNIATEVKLFYRTKLAAGTPPTGCVNQRPDPPPTPTTETCFKPWTPATPAADVATVTTDAGVTVPFIVRVERGTVNRGIYDIAVLFDPAADDVAKGWKPWAPQAGWNKKVVYSFGASSNQPRVQFRSEQSWNAEEVALSRGFLVAINSMTDSLYNSNRTLMTETLMMMKEKIIDSFGEVRYVIGDGCSGGSINQLTASSIYPGLLDGIQPTCTYPDSETTAMEVVDCFQLTNAYSSPAWAALMAHEGPGGTPVPPTEVLAKMAAINGHIDQRGCVAWVNSFANGGRPGHFFPYTANPATGLLNPEGAPPADTKMNNCRLPEALVYNAQTNTEGVRCSGADFAVAIFGKTADGKRARTTTDNVGIQYGLKALIDGKITPEDFIVVNEQAGGVDSDVKFTATRTAGDPDAIAIAYRAGIVSDARHLAKTAIIDLRGWDDQGIHHQWRSFALRARLDRDNGNHDNYVMWRFGTGLIAPAASGLTLQSFLTIDSWLDAMKKDGADLAIERKLTNSKPTTAFEFCYLGTDFVNKVTDAAMCDSANDARLKPHSSPRQVAGGPLTEDIIKCQLKPINAADYLPVVFDEPQLARLRAVFPTGVCDFSKPGVGQQPAVSPLDFSAGPGGVPFPSPPTTKGP